MIYCACEVTNMKANKTAYAKCCAYCEKARYTDNPDYMYCTKKKKDVPGEKRCLAFFYDVLKREANCIPVIPGIDPDSLL